MVTEAVQSFCGCGPKFLKRGMNKLFSFQYKFFWLAFQKKRKEKSHHYSCTVYGCTVYQAFLLSQNCQTSLYRSADGWTLTSFRIYPPLMLLFSILLCVERRCRLIAHWAKLVLLHLGEQSELGANVAPCGSLNGITMANRLWLRYFNGIVQGDSQQPLLNTATWEIFKHAV